MALSTALEGSDPRPEEGFQAIVGSLGLLYFVLTLLLTIVALFCLSSPPPVGSDGLLA